METDGASWEWLADAPDRSAGRRAAGAWAAGVPRDALGEEWPARAPRPLGIPLEFARTHTLAMIECVELALLLDETAALPGRADVRTELRGDRTADRVAHAAAQLELAALATRLGWEAHLERRHRGSATPVDVSVGAPAGPEGALAARGLPGVIEILA